MAKTPPGFWVTVSGSIQLGWSPAVSFDELVEMMVDADLEMAARERTLVDAGHDVTLPSTGRGR